MAVSHLKLLALIVVVPLITFPHEASAQDNILQLKARLAIVFLQGIEGHVDEASGSYTNQISSIQYMNRSLARTTNRDFSQGRFMQGGYARHIERIESWDIFSVDVLRVYVSHQDPTYERIAVSDSGDVVWLNRPSCQIISDIDLSTCTIFPVDFNKYNSPQYLIESILIHSIRYPGSFSNYRSEVINHIFDYNEDIIYGNIEIGVRYQHYSPYFRTINYYEKTKWTYRISSTGPGVLARVE